MRIGLLFYKRDYMADQLQIGIYRYARPSKPWFFSLYDPTKPPEGPLECDALFNQSSEPPVIRWLNSRPIPVISFVPGRFSPLISKVLVNDEEVGRLAADFFLNLGYSHFGYYGLPLICFSSLRYLGFKKRLEESGCRVMRHHSHQHHGRSDEAHITHIPDAVATVSWLKRLPKPAAVFCCDDTRAQWLNEICFYMHYKIPDDVSILGVNNDELHCFRAFPPLSSVQIPYAEMGYQGARMLDQITQNKADRSSILNYQPGSIAERASTDIAAVDDPRLIKALRFIRERACSGISVIDVARHAGISRRVLENRFRDRFNRTPFREIRSAQIKRIRQLLEQTDLPMDDIAEQTGFSDRIRMSKEFKKQTGTAPAEYRKAHRRGSAR